MQNPKWLPEISVSKFIFTTPGFLSQILWNMLCPCQMECFKIENVDLYIHLAVNKASDEQLLKLLKSQMQVPMQADRGGTKSSF